MADPYTSHANTLVDNSPAAAVHTALGTGIGAAIMGWLPQVLALIVAIVGAFYYTICIYESRTIQKIIKHSILARHLKHIARLRAKELMLQAQIKALTDDLDEPLP